MAMSIPDDELQVVLLKLDDERRAIRVVHVPSGISVEDDGTSTRPIIERRNVLVQQLAEILRKSKKGRTPS